MKQLLLTITLLLGSFYAFSQNTIDEKVHTAEKDIDAWTKRGVVLIDKFQSDDKNKYGSHDFLEFSVRAIQDEQTDSLILNIECIGDALGNHWIRIYPEDMSTFLQAMATIRDKFIEWREVAKTNSITEFKKDIPLSKDHRVYRSFLFKSPERDPYYVCSLIPTFEVDKSGNSSVLIKLTDKRGSTEGTLLFSSESKLEHLLYIIQPDYVSAVFERTQQRIKELDQATHDRDALFQ